MYQDCTHLLLVQCSMSVCIARIDSFPLMRLLQVIGTSAPPAPS